MKNVSNALPESTSELIFIYEESSLFFDLKRNIQVSRHLKGRPPIAPLLPLSWELSHTDHGGESGEAKTGCQYHGALGRNVICFEAIRFDLRDVAAGSWKPHLHIRPDERWNPLVVLKGAQMVYC